MGGTGGIVFLEDGRLSDGVALRSMEEAHRYVLMQKRYQYRIKICSLDGQVILEERQGKRVEPSGIANKRILGGTDGKAGMD